MKYLTVTAVMFLAFTVAACSGRQPPGGDLWKIPKYVEQQR